MTETNQIKNRSPLASQVSSVRDPKGGWDRGTPWGLLLHTTGGGVTDDVVRDPKHKGKTPVARAIEIYIDAQNGGNGYLWGGPHYVMDHDGALYQLAPDNLNMQHAGAMGVRPLYFSGAWESRYPVTTAAWKKQWPGKSHPYALFPSTSPNHDYIGCEMIPCGDGFGTPMRPGLRFTQAQHDAAIRLAHDCGARHGWPAGWMRTSRLLGHEDVDPLNRSFGPERGKLVGAWDPGAMREDPWFDFAYVRAAVELPG